MSDLLTILRAAETLLKEGWIQGQMAADRQGNLLPTGSSDAACFCMLGAVYAASERLIPPGERQSRRLEQALALLQRVARTPHLPMWNARPQRTQEQVLSVFRRAIKREEKRALSQTQAST